MNAIKRQWLRPGFGFGGRVFFGWGDRGLEGWFGYEESNRIWNLSFWNLGFALGQVPRGMKPEIFPCSETDFFDTIYDRQPRFNRGDSGNVKGLTLVKDVRLNLLSNSK